MFYRLLPDIGLSANTSGSNDSGYLVRYEEMRGKKITLEIYAGSSLTPNHNDFSLTWWTNHFNGDFHCLVNTGLD